MFNRRHQTAVAALAIVALFATLPATAAEIEVGSAMGTVTLNSDTVGTVDPIAGTDAFQWTGNMTNSTMGWGLTWDLTIDPDPGISGVAAFTNLTGVTMNFTYNVSALSTIAIGSPTVFGSSAITVTDGVSLGGATMSALTGDSIYNAFINAATQGTLFNDPYSLVAPQFGSNSDNASWGPQAATGPLAIGDTFGINHDFSLTPGDQATVNSNFFIIPEPATLGLLAFGGIVMLRRRSR
ncbi:MAG: PEP-CTERM sorting domain-containing protein [Phycisphaerales bacterium]|nr:PEP-CTERM sorting domain-containing protein [Phycisphaerales bacterium]MCB9855931.1 PEP-CTERM sorting domain-containing protein [Phycisphaerales bacterium]MCB9864088.1 PEP-CTERM sorting domain-containing protein [Phycisphaerales bacterium]